MLLVNCSTVIHYLAEYFKSLFGTALVKILRQKYDCYTVGVTQLSVLVNQSHTYSMYTILSE